MSHNTNQGLLVILISLLISLAILMVIGTAYERHQGILAQTAGRNSIRGSMRRSFDQAFGSGSNSTNLAANSISSQELLAAFCDAEHHQLKYTGFLPAEQIWIAKGPVKLNSSNLLCVAELWAGERLGIDGEGRERSVTGTEFTNWPHVPTSDIAAGRTN